MSDARRVPRAAGAEPRTRPSCVIVTGMSGAGRSTAANVLEDLGWFVVDNLPPALIPTMVDLAAAARAAVPRIAVGGRRARRRVLRRPPAPRWRSWRRTASHAAVCLPRGQRRRSWSAGSRACAAPHPLQGDGRSSTASPRSGSCCGDLRGDADLVIDTTDLNVHELRGRSSSAFPATPSEPGLRATVVSFGFKYGLPVDADLVADMRFLPNPHWVPELRPLTGLDAGGRGLRARPARRAASSWTAYADAAASVVADGLPAGGQALRDRRRRAAPAASTASVAMAEELAADGCVADGVDVAVVHRDLGRE